MDTELGHFGPRTGLYHFNANRDMNVFFGCGLGGTSLVNACASPVETGQAAIRTRGRLGPRWRIGGAELDFGAR